MRLQQYTELPQGAWVPHQMYDTQLDFKLSEKYPQQKREHGTAPSLQLMRQHFRETWPKKQTALQTGISRWCLRRQA